MCSDVKKVKEEDDTLENCIRICANIHVVLLREIKVIFHNLLLSSEMCVSPFFWFDKIISLVTFH